MKSRLLIGLLVSCAPQSSGDDNPTPHPTDSSTPTPSTDYGWSAVTTEQGTSEGQIKVELRASVSYEENDYRRATTRLSAWVRETLSGPDVEDAQVTGGLTGQSSQTFQHVGEGDYELVVDGAAGGAFFDISYGGGSVTGVVVAIPAIWEVDITPDPPSVGAPLTLTWGQNGSGSAQVFVDGPSGLTFETPYTLPNDGQESIPAAAFPEAGEYEIIVETSFRDRELPCETCSWHAWRRVELTRTVP